MLLRDIPTTAYVERWIGFIPPVNWPPPAALLGICNTAAGHEARITTGLERAAAAGTRTSTAS